MLTRLSEDGVYHREHCDGYTFNIRHRSYSERLCTYAKYNARQREQT